MHPATRIAVFGFLLGLARPLHSQVPDGWSVVSSFKTNQIPTPLAPFQGDGGLWLVHPRIPSPPLPVTGLGPDLTGAGLAGTITAHGANCVLRLPDERLAVGEIGRGVSIDLHILTLGAVGPGGVPVTADATLFCGTASLLGEGGGIHQMALLPDGRVLMAVSGIAVGPLGGDHLGIADLAAGTVSPVAASGFLDNTNALTLDASGTTAYLGTFDTQTSGALYSLGVPAGGVAAHIVDLPAGVMNLALDNDGQLLVGCFLQDLLKVDPSTGGVTPLGLAIDVYNAVAVEKVTGNYFVQQQDTTVVPPPAWISLVEPGPSVTQLLLSLPGGIGAVSGIDQNHDPETFGPASPGASSYEWLLAPNPGGLPLAGSPFSLTLAATPGATAIAGLFALSKFPYDPPVPALGVLLNVDFGSIILSKPLTGAPLEQVDLPIPPQPSLVGVELFAQAGYLEPGGFAASSGLALTIL